MYYLTETGKILVSLLHTELVHSTPPPSKIKRFLAFPVNAQLKYFIPAPNRRRYWFSYTLCYLSVIFLST